jgi:hypothetical protein
LFSLPFPIGHLFERHQGEHCRTREPA